MPSFHLSDSFRQLRFAVRTHESEARNPDIGWWCVTGDSTPLRLSFKREAQAEWLSRDQLFGWVPSGHPFRKAIALVAKVDSGLDISIDVRLTGHAIRRIVGNRIAFEVDEQKGRLGVLSSDCTLARFDMDSFQWVGTRGLESVIVGLIVDAQQQILELSLESGNANPLFGVPIDGQLLFASRNMALTASTDNEDQYVINQHRVGEVKRELPLEIPADTHIAVSEDGLYLGGIFRRELGETAVSIWSVEDRNVVFQEIIMDVFEESQPVLPVWTQSKLWYVTRDYEVSNIFAYDITNRRLDHLGECSAFISSIVPFEDPK